MTNRLSALAVLLSLVLSGGCGEVAPVAFEIETITVETPAGLHAMVLVPEGVFTMGTNAGTDDEGPAHQVFLDEFYIDRFEVTNEKYNAFVEQGGGSPSVYVFSDQFNQPNQPVVGIGWDEARGYCEWAGLRLPTEAEWEKAARGTDGHVYPWGDASPSRQRAHYFSDTGPAPVGSFPDGQSPYGAYDMSGNVWEYVRDHYVEDFYRFSPERNPVAVVGDGEPDHTIRGGSWASEPDQVKVTTRLRDWLIESDQPDSEVGFRCARN